MDDKSRLEELRGKETLTGEEMQELIRLSLPGAFQKGPNLLTMGVTDVGRAFDNFKEGPARTRHALENGCYLEVISLRLQHTEFWLRMFWVAKNRGRKIFESDDRRTFGMIIKDCNDLGFRSDLVVRLKEFNQHRINAIHKYLLGATDYNELKNVCEASTGLDGEVGEYVRNEIGIHIR
ncbi:MAG: hypothetical protein ACUBOA_04435 [Candidatus Loosdrechtia sp.]|uniref:hypothetical protein n=1 Tax=Candidatus Loosdrechtia sp. TaxID=3101272 RepID=UPI003A786ABC|nr:MAG: hypothetical protein QY305_08160 [Candidatus Jettenia sp. AMX2]